MNKTMMTDLYELTMAQTYYNENKKDEIKVNTAIDEIKSKFGKNSIVKASSLLPDSTAIARNEKIGGHHE